MLYVIAVILFVLWLAGLLTTHLFSDFVHFLLIAAVVVLLFSLLTGKHSS